jgi:hypothetical protein
MPHEQPVDRARDPGVEIGLPLTTRHNVPVRLFYPPRPRVGITLRDFVGAQALPLAEVNLTQRGVGFRWQADGGADGLGGVEGALEVAGIVAGEGAALQAAGDELRLAASFARQRRIELALDSVLAVPRRLAVADEKQARGGGSRR